MNRQDLQLLRRAALDLQANNHDLVRVAGIVQRIKNWWKAKFNPEFSERQEKVEVAYDAVKEPLQELIGQLKELDNAFRAQDPDTVARLVSQVPEVISKMTKDMGKLSIEMKKTDALIPVSYVDDQGRELSNERLEWITKGYKSHKTLLDKLKSYLPEEYQQIPLEQPINKPITEFSWFTRYKPDNINISNAVKQKTLEMLNMAISLKTELTDDIANAIINGLDEFINNLKTEILQNSKLLRVDFPDISKKVTHRPPNEMLVAVSPGFVLLPVKDDSIPIWVDLVKLHDLGARPTRNTEMSVFIIRGLRLPNEAIHKLKVMQEIQQEPIIEASDGPVTRLVKQAVKRQKLFGNNMGLK